ncbi:hypothetical protein [Rugamonas apoptosis]|uniref:Porin n=1 Tax=Rugamonas apoptosis TaxID=2758570 RepID=A0A7W2FCM8_9BURK|nr:hypothetical protein [Rugamonas apoptosis]MBA5689109.1 hypothetical protein [Rugamonas apoptosis]
MRKKTVGIATLAVLGAMAGAAQAQEGGAITISGFGTAAVTRSNTDDGQFARVNQAAGAGKDARTGVDSNFGIQATAKLSGDLSLTAQGLARKYGQRDQYDAELAWAFLKYKVSDDFSVRLGRIGLPIYMISDVVNVGYANTMLRPPTEMYRQVPLDFANGGDLMYQHSFGDTTVTAQIAMGTAKNITPTVTVNSGLVASQLLLENGPFTYRVAHSFGNVSFHNPDFDALLGVLRQAGLGTVASELDSIDRRSSFTSVGLTMDYANVLAQAEYGKRKVDTPVVPNTSSWYIMLGYRWNKFVPFYMHGDVKQNSVRGIAALPDSGPLAPVSAAVNSLARSPLQSTDAVGLRWDFHKSAAFKVQIDRVKPRDGAGFFLNTKPGFSGPVTVYAAAVDFLY